MANTRTVVVAGYGAWAKTSPNPAALTIAQLAERSWPSCRLVALEIPVRTHALHALVEDALLAHRPDVWLGIGVAPNRGMVRGAVNDVDAVSQAVKEAVTTAHMAREVFGTSWIKLELIGHTDSLQPDVFQLVEAAKILSDEGFQVFPYTTDDLIVGERLLAAGCKVLMPWGAPIGSGRGLNNTYALRAMRAEFPDTPLVVDAGIGLPSHASAAMELGFDAVLLNTAVAKAGDPAAMAKAMMQAVEAGAGAHAADPIEARDMAEASTPVIGKAFLA